MSEETKAPPAAAGQAGKYEEDAVYQNGKIVAHTLGVEVRSASSEIHFDEINDSELLMLPEECEFQKYRLIVKKIEYASRIDKSAPQKGRVLRGVIAEILGYREQ